jgi:hypothetical protein
MSAILREQISNITRSDSDFDETKKRTPNKKPVGILLKIIFIANFRIFINNLLLSSGKENLKIELPGMKRKSNARINKYGKYSLAIFTNHVYIPLSIITLH